MNNVMRVFSSQLCTRVGFVFKICTVPYWPCQTSIKISFCLHSCILYQQMNGVSFVSFTKNDGRILVLVKMNDSISFIFSPNFFVFAEYRGLKLYYIICTRTVLQYDLQPLRPYCGEAEIRTRNGRYRGRTLTIRPPPHNFS